MISVYFGLPGVGKTTHAVSMALKFSKQKHRKYKYIYCNFECNIPGVICINNNVLGHYDLASDGSAAVFIDEATLFADSRDFKNFDYDRLLFFVLHRHFKTDVFLYTQYFDGIDKRIRLLVDRCFYMYKGLFTGSWFSQSYRIPYTILIPKKDTDNSHIGEIVQGYYKPGFFTRLLTHKWLFRPLYYKYFDSFSKIELPPLPADYKFDIRQQYYSPNEIENKERSDRKKDTLITI